MKEQKKQQKRQQKEQQSIGIKAILGAIPYPISGVVLSIVSLGNLLSDLTQYIHIACGIISTICFLILTIKIFVCREELKDGLKDPVITSTYPTYSMTMMMLSVYLQPMSGKTAIILWGIGVLLHIIIVTYFTYQFLVVHMEWHKMHACYFVGYAGIATIAITSPAYGLNSLGMIAFWVGFISVTAMMLLVTYRNIKYPYKEPNERPLRCVYASPWNVCLIGYLHSYTHIDVRLVVGIYGVAFLLYLVALTNVKQSIGRTFYTSYASYTFPFVVAASGTKQMMLRLMEVGVMEVTHLHIWMWIQIVISIILVTFTCVQYGNHIRLKIKGNNV